MSNGVRIIKVNQDDDGQRLDRWLKRVAPDLPYVLVQKLIRKGQIRIDGGRCKTDTKISGGQEVRLPPYQADRAPKDQRKSKLSDKDAQFIRSLVIHQDGDVIALNKPAGLAVQGGTKIKKHIDGMLDAFTGKNGVRPRIVHRLDKDTSGVLLLARNAKTAKKLGAMFKGRDIKKIYWAIVTPTPEIHDGKIKAPLLKAESGDKEKVTVDEKEGKFALTEYRVIERAADLAAFVAFWPRTGRTHQIRVHAQILGSPILGDGKYGGQDAFLEGVDHPRQLHLHARRLILPHPTQKGILDISAPLPAELAKSWKALGFNTKNKEDPFEDLN